MKNWEKYESEIRKFIDKGKGFGLFGKELGSCLNNSCMECKFNTVVGCNYEVVAWLFEEVKPTLTKRERAFCEIFCFAGAKWIARNENGFLNLFYIKPHKTKTSWDNYSINSIGAIDRTAFPFITWEDKEPWSIAELLELEVE